MQPSIPTPPPAMPPNIPPPPPVPGWSPSPPPQHKKRTGLLVGLGIGFVVLLALPIIGLLFFITMPEWGGSDADGVASGNCVLRGAAAEESLFNFGHCNVDEINETIAEKNIHSLVAPDLMVCAPDASLHETDRAQWLAKWGECLDAQWNPVLIDADSFTDPGMVGPITLINSFSDVETNCKTEEVDGSAGFFCIADDQIYIVAQYTGDIAHDLKTVFHEYTHHLQFRYGIQIDSGVMIDELYKYRGDMQPMSHAEAVAQDKRRRELNAECGAAVMLQQAGINTSQMSNDLAAEAGYKTHGSMVARQLALDRGAASGGKMSACNTWQWPADEINN